MGVQKVTRINDFYEMIYIIRNNHEYGPYDETVVAGYVEQGILLAHDKARDAGTGRMATVGELLGERGFHPQVRHRGTLGQQLRAIGSEFIFPKDDMARHHWLDDKRLLVLAIVGLSLSVLMLLPIGGLLVFYAVSLYFAVVWGLFFYAFFRTRQVNVKTTVSVFFLTQVAVFVIFSGLNQLNFFYFFTRMAFPVNIVGYVLGVGLTEEFCQDDAPPVSCAPRPRAPVAPDAGLLRPHVGHRLRCV